MKTAVIAVMAVILSAPVWAQEPPTFTPAERADFAAARALETMANAKAVQSREGKALLKAREALKRAEAAFLKARAASPEWQAYVSLRLALDGVLRQRQLQVNWDTGALAPLSTPAAR